MERLRKTLVVKLIKCFDVEIDVHLALFLNVITMWKNEDVLMFYVLDRCSKFHIIQSLQIPRSNSSLTKNAALVSDEIMNHEPYFNRRAFWRAITFLFLS